MFAQKRREEELVVFSAARINRGPPDDAQPMNNHKDFRFADSVSSFGAYKNRWRGGVSVPSVTA
jgi:hypothetical protein